MSNRLIMTLLVRDELNIIKENILFHLNEGVDFVIVTDNGSTDGTRDILSDFEREGIIHVIDEPTQDYAQAKWVTRMALLAKENYSADWVMHNDADEFWFAKSGNLKDELDSNLFNVLRCNRFNMLPEEHQLVNPGFKFYDAVHKVQNPFVGFNRLGTNEHPFFTYKVQVKVMSVVDNSIFVEQGNHDVKLKNKVEKTSTNIEIFHYPIRTYEEFELKVKNGGSSLARNKELPQEVDWHWRYWYELYSNGKLKNEYDKLIIKDKSDLLAKNVIVVDNTIKDAFESNFTRFVDNSPTEIYDDQFYKMHEAWISEYDFIAEQLCSNFPFDSVVDFGCGNGYFLNSLNKKNKSITGIEASINAINAAPAKIKKNIINKDLRLPLFVGKFDLVICTEVAEHLDEIYADTLVDTISRASNRYIFFTGATPDQTGGINHVNLQQHEYWKKKFNDRGFEFQKEITQKILNEVNKNIKYIVWFNKNIMIFKKKSEGLITRKANRNNNIILMTNFRTMYPETVQTLNQINDAVESSGYKLLLLSSSTSEELKFPVIQIPFSFKEWSSLKNCEESNQFYNDNLIDIDIEFNDDKNADRNIYAKGIQKCLFVAHQIVKFVKPAYTLLWSGTLPQSVLFKSVFDSYFIPTFFAERGLLPETLMFDLYGNGAYSSLKFDTTLNDFTKNDTENFERIKNYYLEKKIEKHKQSLFESPQSYIERNNISGKRILFFAGQWDVASGVNITRDYQSHRNSPFLKNTPDAFSKLSAQIASRKDTVLIFKPHPFDSNTYLENRENGILVDRKANVHTLVQCADVIGVMSTTVQYEALFYEKPIVLLGNSFLNGWDAGYELNNLTYLRELLEKAFSKTGFEEKIKNVHRFINYITERYLISLNSETSIGKDLNRYFINIFTQNSSSLEIISSLELENITKEVQTMFTKTINPMEISNLIKLSEDYIEKNEIAEAKKILTKILTELDPDSIDAANNYAVAELLDGNADSAKLIINQVLDRDPQNEIALGNLEYINQTVMTETNLSIQMNEQTQAPSSQIHSSSSEDLIKKYNLNSNYQSAIGGGDFVKVGEDLLQQMIKACNLSPDEKVLDVGSGYGRLALPLSKYLSEKGEYRGMEIVKNEVDWCTDVITSQRNNFKFIHADVYNFHYNRGGSTRPCFYKFPFESNYFDFVLLTSVFTHMLSFELNNYLSEIARVLKPGGRSFITYFLMNEESKRLMKEQQSAMYFPAKIGEFWLKDVNDPEAAVCFDESFILDLYKKHGLKVELPLKYGQWSGRKPFFDYQDVIIAKK